MTFKDLVREVADQYGHVPPLSDEECMYILWEWTGFPGFFHGDPETCCREQLHEYFQGKAIHVCDQQISDG